MATPKSQRIGIWIIAIVLTLGTFGSFAVMGLSVKNSAAEQAKAQEDLTKYQEEVAAQTKELSEKYYSEFSQYANLPAAFTASSVTDLSTQDLKIGDGDTITSDSSYSAYYIGWKPDGTVFDESISGESLKAPISSGSMITGWDEGVIGMKVGGVRVLTIPSSKAYGSTGNSDSDIPANTPLKFVVMIIPKIDTIEIPQSVIDYYTSTSS